MDGKPELKNGYTKIANELIEAIVKTNFNAYQIRVLFAIIRKTYGWNKKQDWIPLSQLVELTGIAKSHVSRAKKELSLRKIVTQRGNQIQLNKYYQQWEKLPNGVTPYRVTQRGNTVTQRDNKKLPNWAHSKEKKETYSKEIYNVESQEIRLAELLFKKILENDPKAKKPNLQKWAIHIDRLIRIDKREPDEIERVIEWCQEDYFWRSNILSTTKLRKNYQQAKLQMEGRHKYGIPSDW